MAGAPAEARADGRSTISLRPMRCERGVLKRADGSARYSQERTSVLVAVYGPCEVKKRREELDRATLELVVRPMGGPPGPRERECEGLIHGLFAPLLVATLHPRAAISVVVQILEEDGSLLACMINCVAVALMDAGIAMRCIPTAIALAIGTTGVSATLLDPCRVEETAAAGTLTIACAQLPSAAANLDGPQIALLVCAASLAPEELEAHVRLAQGAHTLVCEFARRALSEGLVS